MVDLRPDFKLGENVLKNTDDNSFGLVELDSTVIPGEVVKVTGVNSDGAEIVGPIGGVIDDIKYMIMEAGVAGEMARVLHKGRTKVTFGGVVIAGTRLEFTMASKVIFATGTIPMKATAVDDGVLDDTGFIDFDGGINPP